MSSANHLSPSEITSFAMRRWKARTDLFYLAHDILGYNLIDPHVHAPIINSVQKFPVPTRLQFEANDRYVNGKWIYRPLVEKYDLPGSRRVLILDPRSGLKTTINAISHTIQWILNYPDVRILITQATAERAEDILSEIKSKFQDNELLRLLFPEHCPQKKIYEWGTKAQFSTEARTHKWKESTVQTSSIDKGSAGYHFDVMKFSDIVDERNSINESQLKAVWRQFGTMENLVIRPDSWIDVEGTRYDFSDVYGEIIESDEKRVKLGRKPVWKVHVRGCYVKDTGNQPPKYTVEELALPDKLGPDGKKISWWPKQWPVDSLEDYRIQNGDLIFFMQKCNNPIPTNADMMPFPVNDHYPKMISLENFKRHVRTAYLKTTIDTAQTKNEGSDFSVITTCAWGIDGRCYVINIERGRWLADELCMRIIFNYIRYKPETMLIEEDAYVRGLEATLRRWQDIKNVSIPLQFIKRENDQTKKERILNTLQPWYKSGDLRFMENMNEEQALFTELARFPKYKHDDIMDTLADQFRDKKWFGREGQRDLAWTPDTRDEIQNRRFRAWLQIEGEGPVDPGLTTNGFLPTDFHSTTGIL